MKKKIILIGAGGHSKSCIDLIETSTNFKISHVMGLKKEMNKNILKYKINLLEENIKKIKTNKLAVIGVGQIKSSKKRKYFFSFLKANSFVLPIIKSKNSYVSKYSKIEEGTLVFHGAVINANTKIGKNCIINSKSLIEHDVIVKNHVHVSTGARINGGCEIGEGSFIGSGAIICQNVKIGKNCIIGAGAIIKKNIGNNRIVK